jgi:hypothetical protein
MTFKIISRMLSRQSVCLPRKNPSEGRPGTQGCSHETIGRLAVSIKPGSRSTTGTLSEAFWSSFHGQSQHNPGSSFPGPRHHSSHQVCGVRLPETAMLTLHPLSQNDAGSHRYGRSDSPDMFFSGHEPAPESFFLSLPTTLNTLLSFCFALQLTTPYIFLYHVAVLYLSLSLPPLLFFS